MARWWPDDEIIGDKIDQAKKKYQELTTNVSGMISQPVLLGRARRLYDQTVGPLIQQGQQAVTDFHVEDRLSRARRDFDAMTQGATELNRRTPGTDALAGLSALNARAAGGLEDTSSRTYGTLQDFGDTMGGLNARAATGLEGLSRGAAGALEDTAGRYEAWRNPPGAPPRPSPFDTLGQVSRTGGTGGEPLGDTLREAPGRLLGALGGQGLEPSDDASRRMAESAGAFVHPIEERVRRPLAAFAQTMGNPNYPRLDEEQANRLVESAFQNVSGYMGGSPKDIAAVTRPAARQAERLGFDAFHGTDQGFDTLQASRSGMLGKGRYFSVEPEGANAFAETRGGEGMWGGQVRPVDIADDIRLWDSTQQVTPEEGNRFLDLVRQRARRAGMPWGPGTDGPLRDMLRPGPGRDMPTRFNLYDQTASSMAWNSSSWAAADEAKELLNDVLRRQGYQGISYRGTRSLMRRDAAGNLGRYTEVNVFPEWGHLVRNKLSGREFGIVPGGVGRGPAPSGPSVLGEGLRARWRTVTPEALAADQAYHPGAWILPDGTVLSRPAEGFEPHSMSVANVLKEQGENPKLWGQGNLDRALNDGIMQVSAVNPETAGGTNYMVAAFGKPMTEQQRAAWARLTREYKRWHPDATVELHGDAGAGLGTAGAPSAKSFSLFPDWMPRTARADLAAATAGGIYGGVTAPEDTPPWERAQRVAFGALQGVQALNQARGLARAAGNPSAALRRLRALRVAGEENGDLFTENLRKELDSLQAGIERRNTDWESLSQVRDQLEDEIGALREFIGQGKAVIEKPPDRGVWAMKGAKWRQGDLAELASRSGLNPYEPGWWQAADDETVRLYKREVLAQRGPPPLTPHQELQQKNARWRDVRKQVKQLEQELMQDINRQAQLEDRMQQRGLFAPPATPAEELQDAYQRVGSLTFRPDKPPTEETAQQLAAAGWKRLEQADGSVRYENPQFQGAQAAGVGEPGGAAVPTGAAPGPIQRPQGARTLPTRASTAGKVRIRTQAPAGRMRASMPNPLPPEPPRPGVAVEAGVEPSGVPQPGLPGMPETEVGRVEPGAIPPRRTATDIDLEIDRTRRQIRDVGQDPNLSPREVERETARLEDKVDDLLKERRGLAAVGVTAQAQGPLAGATRVGQVFPENVPPPAEPRPGVAVMGEAPGPLAGPTEAGRVFPENFPPEAPPREGVAVLGEAPGPLGGPTEAGRVYPERFPPEAPPRPGVAVTAPGRGMFAGTPGAGPAGRAVAEIEADLAGVEQQIKDAINDPNSQEPIHEILNRFAPAQERLRQELEAAQAAAAGGEGVRTEVGRVFPENIPPERTVQAIEQDIAGLRSERDIALRDQDQAAVRQIDRQLADLREELLNKKGVGVLVSPKPGGTPLGERAGRVATPAPGEAASAPQVQPTTPLLPGMPQVEAGRVYPEHLEPQEPPAPPSLPGAGGTIPPGGRPPEPGAPPPPEPMRQPELPAQPGQPPAQWDASQVTPGTNRAVVWLQKRAAEINQSRYANLLIGTANAFGDIVSNLINIPRLYARTAGAAQIERALPVARRATTPSQVKGLNRGLSEGWLQGVKEAWDVFMEGTTREQREAERAAGVVGAGGQVNPDMPTTPTLFRGKKALPLMLGTRIRLAADSLVTNIGERMASYSLGFREADRAGLKPGSKEHLEYAENVTRHIQENMQSIRAGLQPGERVPQGGVYRRPRTGMSGAFADRLDYEALAKEAFATAADLASQRALGRGAATVANARAFAPLRGVMAFYRTSARISSDMLQEHPVIGPIGSAIDVGKAALGHGPYAATEAGEAALEVLARSRDASTIPLSQRLVDHAIGGMVATTGAALAANGVITGLGPLDASVRRKMQDEGWRPLAYVVPDGEGGVSGYIPLVRLLGAHAMSLGFGATMYEILAAGEGLPPDKVIGDFLLSQENMWSSQTGLRDLYELLNVVFTPDPQEAGRSLEKLAGNVIGGYAPLSGLFQTYNRATDEVVRDPRNVWERVAVLYNPAAAEPRTTETGQEVPRGPGERGVRSFLPFQEVQAVPTLRRYPGSESAATDAEITAALNTVRNWTRDPIQYAAPTGRQITLAEMYQGLQDEEYTQRRAEERRRRRVRAREEEQRFWGIPGTAGGGGGYSDGTLRFRVPVGTP